MAKKQEKRVVTARGTESALSNLGTCLLVIGILVFILSIVAGGFSGSSEWNMENISLLPIILSFAFLIFGIASFIVLRAGADVIRLLKKSSGLEFTGKVSQPAVEIEFCCSQCTRFVSEDETECHHCGEKFE